MTDRQTVRIAARDLAIGDRINRAPVTRIDTDTTPGVVYVWIDDNPTVRADMIFNHGDPVRIERRAPVIVRDPGEDMADRWNETHS